MKFWKIMACSKLQVPKIKYGYQIKNKRNDKRFINHGYSLFFLMSISLKHLWLIPNILKWQGCKIFTKLVPSQTSSRSSHRWHSVQRGIPKNLRNFTGKIPVLESHFKKIQAFRPVFLFKRDSNTVLFFWNSRNVWEHLFWRTSAKDCFCPS